MSTNNKTKIIRKENKDNKEISTDEQSEITIITDFELVILEGKAEETDDVPVFNTGDECFPIIGSSIIDGEHYLAVGVRENNSVYKISELKQTKDEVINKKKEINKQITNVDSIKFKEHNKYYRTASFLSHKWYTNIFYLVGMIGLILGITTVLTGSMFANIPFTMFGLFFLLASMVIFTLTQQATLTYKTNYEKPIDNIEDYTPDLK